jgi:hypothetical protein
MQWPGGRPSVLVAANRVIGLQRGWYHANPALSRLADYQSDELSERYVDAPALLIICGGAFGTSPTAGAEDYSRALVQAAGLGYAIWLEAVSHGLAGCVFGRTYHLADAAARGMGVRQLFTLALGHEAVGGKETTP